MLKVTKLPDEEAKAVLEKLQESEQMPTLVASDFSKVEVIHPKGNEMTDLAKFIHKANLSNDTKIGFKYTFELFDPDGSLVRTWEQENLIPNAGRDYIVNAAVNGASQLSSWYVGLFKADRTPVAGDTMTLFLADASESSDYTTTANHRLAITPDALAAGVWANAAAPCEFTFSAIVNIYGSFITSGDTRAATTGLLLSAVKFTTMETTKVGSILRVTAGFSMVTV